MGPGQTRYDKFGNCGGRGPRPTRVQMAMTWLWSAIGHMSCLTVFVFSHETKIEHLERREETAPKRVCMKPRLESTFQPYIQPCKSFQLLSYETIELGTASPTLPSSIGLLTISHHHIV